MRRAGGLPAGELRDRLHRGDAVPDLDEPLGVLANQFVELLFGREYAGTGFARCLLRAVKRNVIFVVKRKVFHRAISVLCGVCRGHHINHLGVLGRQA